MITTDSAPPSLGGNQAVGTVLRHCIAGSELPTLYSEGIYVVIVPDPQPSGEPTVKIQQVQQNVTFATVGDPNPRTF